MTAINPGILVLLFFIPMFLGVPIGFALGMMILFVTVNSTFITSDVMVQTFFTSCDSFPLLAVPFFVLAGDIMLNGGLSSRIIDFASACIGRLKGSLGIVTVCACMIFAAISGSGPATVAAIGGLMIPAMVKDNYDKAFACSLAATAGAMGPIIPPSVLFIMYGVMAQVSVTDLFIAGAIPGVVMAVLLALFVYVTAKKYNFGTEKEKKSTREKLHALNEGKWALLVPVIILGGIYGGFVTPTEAGVLACVYALIISLFVHKEIKIKDLPAIFINTCRTTGYCMVFVGPATVLGKILALQHIPDQLANAIYGISTNPVIILLVVNVLFLVLGCFMEPVSSIIIFGPLIVPIITGLGVDPVHFGIVMVLNLVIGMCTPPVGINMFIASGIGKIPPENMFKWLFPMIGVLIVALLIVTYVPQLSLFLVNLIG
ncbi:TRAP transporter large permease [Intestinimonas butyriciproducens]|uniref:TRAP transporter large permease n=1 Tax=Intestinimonas butyriciproducens TaxID=1297617 RepID=UPI001C129838|nr:TRAP transporter large permease [Intestinimonas butyriciproducens]MBU5230472.1 TRAP transporter large permease [Intestinimonas butyriciproducens]